MKICLSGGFGEIQELLKPLLNLRGRSGIVRVEPSKPYPNRNKTWRVYVDFGFAPGAVAALTPPTNLEES